MEKKKREGARSEQAWWSEDWTLWHWMGTDKDIPRLALPEYSWNSSSWHFLPSLAGHSPEPSCLQSQGENHLQRVSAVDTVAYLVPIMSWRAWQANLPLQQGQQKQFRAETPMPTSLVAFSKSFWKAPLWLPWHHRSGSQSKVVRGA